MWKGPRLAAVRRSKFELDLDLTLDELHCGARILYYAEADERFAEYELDYIIFAKVDKPVFKGNLDEVSATEYVSQAGLPAFLQKHQMQITPWFRLMLESGMLEKWWTQLNS